MSGKLNLKTLAMYGDVVVTISGYIPSSWRRGRDDLGIYPQFVHVFDDPDDLKPLLFRERLFAVACRICQDIQLHAVFAAVFQVGHDAFFVVGLVVYFRACVREARPGEIDFAQPGGEPPGQFGEGCRIVRFVRQIMPYGKLGSGCLFCAHIVKCPRMNDRLKFPIVSVLLSIM